LWVVSQRVRVGRSQLTHLVEEVISAVVVTEDQQRGMSQESDAGSRAPQRVVSRPPAGVKVDSVELGVNRASGCASILVKESTVVSDEPSEDSFVVCDDG
tara:strand:+ start:218 stop:517 length:300 start_codon:yes stop_codon:yes gene_type:complete